MEKVLSPLVFLSMFVHVPHKAEIIDYCKIKAKNSPHTVCGNTCALAKNNYALDPTFEWRNIVLKKHNFYRNFFAGGGNTSGGNSQASDIMVLSYDMGLEFTVACWIYSIGIMVHDKNRGTPRFPVGGQNLWTGHRKAGDPTTVKGINNFIWRWYRELQWTRKEWIDKLVSHDTRVKIWEQEGVESRKVGHFTQLVWAKTTHVGCAMCWREDLRKFLVGCNYGPAGNLIGERVYKRGPPTSECPKGTKANSHYPNLCGEIEPWPENINYVGIPEMDERWEKLYPDDPHNPKPHLPRSKPPHLTMILTLPPATEESVVTKKQVKHRRGISQRQKIIKGLVVYSCLGALLFRKLVCS